MSRINMNYSLNEAHKKKGVKAQRPANRQRGNDRAPEFKGKVHLQSNYKRRSSGGAGDFYASSDSYLHRRNDSAPAFNGRFRQQNNFSRRNSGGSGNVHKASNSNSIIRLSNLPFDVTQQELNELFAEFRLPRITLHYDYRGKSLGTAELYGPSNVIARIAHEFGQVKIDNRPLGIELIGSNQATATGIKSRIRRVSSGQNVNGRSSNTDRGFVKARRQPFKNSAYLSRL